MRFVLMSKYKVSTPHWAGCRSSTDFFKFGVPEGLSLGEMSRQSGFIWDATEIIPSGVKWCRLRGVGA